MRGLWALAFGAALAGCATVPGTMPPDRRVAETALVLPAMKRFGAVTPAPTDKTRAQLAADFLDLSFQMESGRTLERFTRFEVPIRVTVRGANVPPSLERDLTDLLGRLQAEAGLDIAQVTGADQPANLVVETLPRARLQRFVPQAACFVVPNVRTWQEFVANRRGTLVDWARLTQRDTAAVFIPDDVSPQEIRDCLHEEIAQAVGPLNDLYRLSDSIFNDDNFHTVLTRFDMLMLRASYAPEMRNGMTKQQAAAVLPGIFARIAPDLPAGVRTATRPVARPWVDAIESALGPGTSARGRLQAAQKSVSLAAELRLEPNQQAFSHYALGRIALGKQPELALAAFLRSAQIYAAMPDATIQRAHVAVQLAAFALAAGRGHATLEILNMHLDAAKAAQNASLLATMLMMQSEALVLEGRAAEAQVVRLDSLAWARYGFGSDAEVRARMAEIAGVTPERRVARLSSMGQSARASMGQSGRASMGQFGRGLPGMALLP